MNASPRRPGPSVRAPLGARWRLWWRELWSGPLGPERALGFLGEDVAARRLRRQGYRVLGRNIRAPMGEVDLVCRAPDGRTVVVVEVKTRLVRSGAQPGDPGRYLPEDAVGWEKRRTLARLAAHLARLNRWDRRRMRIDVIAIEWPSGAEPVIRHWQDAVRA